MHEHTTACYWNVVEARWSCEHSVAAPSLPDQPQPAETELAER